MAMGATRVLAIFILGSCSPFGGGAFHCAEDPDCANGATAGVCDTTVGFCAFSDEMCASGLRYGDASGGQSNQCVGGNSDGDAGPDGLTYPCYGTGILTVCPIVPLTAPLVISDLRAIDTSPASPDCLALAPPGNVDVCAIGGMTVELMPPSGKIVATGSRPLVIVSASTMTIAGDLDVASHRLPQETIGAGANETCTGASLAAAGGGGAGGTFGSVGGTGGANGAGVGGTPDALAALTVRGGCLGQAGAIVSTGTGGVPGHGGGAVYLIAVTSLVVDATIDASGEGGASAIVGTLGGGAGGGGAGGLIGLDTASLTVSTAARLFANGGGGGEGDGVGGTQGVTGGDPAAFDQPASGGFGLSATGGDGGAGAYTTHPAVPGTAGNGGGGGGGGGGGSGVIKVTAPLQQVSGQLSPNPS